MLQSMGSQGVRYDWVTEQGFVCIKKSDLYTVLIHALYTLAHSKFSIKSSIIK